MAGSTGELVVTMKGGQSAAQGLLGNFNSGTVEEFPVPAAP